MLNNYNEASFLESMLSAIASHEVELSLLLDDPQNQAENANCDLGDSV